MDSHVPQTPTRTRTTLRNANSPHIVVKCMQQKVHRFSHSHVHGSSPRALWLYGRQQQHLQSVSSSQPDTPALPSPGHHHLLPVSMSPTPQGPPQWTHRTGPSGPGSGTQHDILGLICAEPVSEFPSSRLTNIPLHAQAALPIPCRSMGVWAALSSW